MNSLILLPQTQLDLGEVWLKQMGEAAQRYGITIQYIELIPLFINYNNNYYYQNHALWYALPLLTVPLFDACRYCTAWTRHVMQSIAIPAVTQVRISGDYQPNNNQWLIGDSSILSDSIGLAPSKDVSLFLSPYLSVISLYHCSIFWLSQNFRTSSNQPDCHVYRGGKIESYPAVETYAAVLSSGPVGPSDQIGTANVTLIMATW